MTDPVQLKLSITELVEFGARTGDLYYERPAGPTALQGIIGHQRIQKARGPEWQSEFPLKRIFKIKEYEIHLQGRADLINVASVPCILEEIKTTLTAAEYIPANKIALYWAQARVYGCLYGLLNGGDAAIQIRLSLFNLATQELSSETRLAVFTDLLQETEFLLNVYVDWHRQITARRELVRVSASRLNFPYANFRGGQYAFAGNVYRAIRDGQTLVAEAPTGIGKTISTLFPACKALGERLADQILYLTAKTSGQAQAETALDLMRGKGLHLDSLTLCAKEKLCPCRKADSAADVDGEALLDANGVCRYTQGFYDRLPAAREACLGVPALDYVSLVRIGEAHQICPFALGLQMLTWTTVIIGDYNYFFDPLTTLRAFSDANIKRVLLMDELHNLPERSTNMFSAALSSAQIAELGKHYGKTIAKKCRQMNRTFSALLADKPLHEDLPKALEQQLTNLMESLLLQVDIDRSEMENIPAQTEIDISEKRDTTRLHRDLFRFYTISQLFGVGHRLILRPLRANSSDMVAQLRCIDPAPLLQQRLTSSHACIGFSATLTPLEFYIRVLGLPPKSRTQRLEYPFPPENLLVLRCDYLDTRWQQREASLSALVALFASVIGARPGKYLVFFPSYEYLQKALLQFQQDFPWFHTVAQAPGTDRSAQEQFLHKFFHLDEAVLGFAILGGIFAEGVDYRADALHGAIIVGSGMPQPTDEQQLMVEHFSQRGLNGFQYAYQIPGFTRVLQTAGRVIRSEKDKGVVVLVDPRFARTDFKRLMPFHWRPVSCGNLNQANMKLRDFWASV